jgi:hypothetical protein
MPFDYTDAPPPSFDLIPDGTIATLSIHIRPGDVGEDGMLKRNKAGDAEMLDLEFTVVDGAYKGRKFWNNLLLVGSTDGQKKMAAGNLGTLKAILDSALGLKPNDVSATARAARTVSVRAFERMCFIGKIGIEIGGPRDRSNPSSGNYPDKNVLAGVITPDKTDWHPVEQLPPFDGGGTGAAASTPSAPAASVERPSWAQ